LHEPNVAGKHKRRDPGAKTRHQHDPEDRFDSADHECKGPRVRQSVLGERSRLAGVIRELPEPEYDENRAGSEPILVGVRDGGNAARLFTFPRG